MSKSFKGGRKKADFLNKIPTLDLESSGIPSRCKFNFSYFSVPDAGQDFREWEQSETLSTLMAKIKEYTNQTLMYWVNQGVLVNYGNFPNKNKTDFQHPTHVPHDVSWGRFRLGSRMRLVGFMIPGEFENREFVDERGKRYHFDVNTFYVTFLDANHKFYKVEKK